MKEKNIMDLFTRDDLKVLLKDRPGPCVSLFMPAHRGGSEQDPIRFRNLLGAAEDRLVTFGLRAPEARDLLAPARALLGEPFFWKDQCDGLALFQGADFLRVYRLPLPLGERVAVEGRFCIRPLLPLLACDGRYYVLAFSQNGVRLLQGTRHTVAEVDLRGVPTSLAEALATHDQDEPLGFHTHPALGLGRKGAIFHGQGVGIDDTKDDLLRFFQRVDRGLHAVLRPDRPPLVLAAVDYLMPLYREANTYPHLLEKGVEGNPDRLSTAELHDRAWPLVRPHFEQVREDALALYHRLAGTGRTVRGVREVVPAAHAGQVETLFVALGAECWGVLDPPAGQVEEHAPPLPGDADLLDLAVADTLRHDGTVYVLPAGEVPGGATVAAIRCLPLAKRGKRP
jgi:hypothetical protein